MATASELHGAAERRLARAEQRYTRQRRSIVALFADADAPMSVPDMLGLADGLSQSSLYRNLVVLESAGVLRRLAGVGNHDRFELSEALSGDHHHHMNCVDCGAVIDIPTSTAFERAVDAEAAAVAERFGVTVDGHSLDLYGRCESCARSRASSAAPRGDSR